MTDYFGHWVNFREKLGYLAPKIFYANWFQADAEGRFIWPGSGENSRVLKWVCGHVDGTGKARPTPLGYLPTVDALDTDGIDTTPVEMAHLLSMDIEGWLKEIPEVCKYYHQFGERLPDILLHNLDELEGLLCGSATTFQKRPKFQKIPKTNSKNAKISCVLNICECNSCAMHMYFQ